MHTVRECRMNDNVSIGNKFGGLQPVKSGEVKNDSPIQSNMTGDLSTMHVQGEIQKNTEVTKNKIDEAKLASGMSETKQVNSKNPYNFTTVQEKARHDMSGNGNVKNSIDISSMRTTIG